MISVLKLWLPSFGKIKSLYLNNIRQICGMLVICSPTDVDGDLQRPRHRCLNDKQTSSPGPAPQIAGSFKLVTAQRFHQPVANHSSTGKLTPNTQRTHKPYQLPSKINQPRVMPWEKMHRALRLIEVMQADGGKLQGPFSEKVAV